jgi:membrane-bound hydrogenase subunit beta
MSYLNQIKKELRGRVRRAKAQRERRVSARTEKKNLRAAISKLVKFEGYSHLSTITAVDIGSEIEVIYHITSKDALLSLKVQVPKEDAILPTIVDLIPGAALYEREVHDLFGVIFEGNPDLSPVLLPDDWPSDVYPLRKEWTNGRISRRLRSRR